MELLRWLEEKGVALNEQQKQAVFSGERRLLLLAVPGSGKTTVLVSRIAYHIRELGVPPFRLLTLTFNRETAADMRRRYIALFGEGEEQPPRFSTIHSFCLRALRAYAQAYNRPMPALIDGNGVGEKAAVLREFYRRRTGEFLTEDLYETLEREIGYAKNMLLSEEDRREGGFETERFAAIFEDYENYKRQHRKMDFDDMLTLTLDIFQRFPSILRQFQGQYDEINVDEAQDTSLVQHRILALLARGGSSLFLVGDEDQSIYSFRGAYPRALLEFPDTCPGGKVIKMEENFRSNADIVFAADRFIRQNKQRYEKNMVCANRREESIQVIRLRDYAEQYRRTFELISALPPGKTAGVLYRNNESAVPLIDLFYRAGRPFYVREHRLAYFSSLVVRDITAYLRLAIDPADLDAFGQIYYKLGYSKGVYEYARKNRGGDNLFDLAAGISSLRPWQRQRALEYREGFAALRLLRPAEALASIERDLNYGSYIERRTAGAFRTQARQKLNTAKCLAEGLRSIYEFLGKLEAVKTAMEERKLVDASAPVTLSTLHSAKGMEFDTVILLDMLADILPSGEASPGTEEYENEARLFYVGATRAREKLVLFQSSLLNASPCAPSIFLRDFLRGPKAREESPARRPARVPALRGKRVVHSLFDEGRVVEQEGTSIVVDFRMFGTKKLDFPTCMEKGLLTILEK